jgi:beta-1,4-mannosyl-glycoprotein beta-1,4-N-acetylglucosaminyltransferase
MKIYDCFIFFNELDLLELRLNILNDYVDYFVIVESSVTFQGEDKEFLFEKNKSRFSKFENKIIYFQVEKYELDFANLPFIAKPKNADEIVLNKIYKFIDDCPHFDKKTQFWWGNDFFQRECIWRALALANPAADDVIVISDVDEIPNPETVKSLKRKLLPESLFCLRQHEFCYYLNYYHNSDWVGTCCFLYASFNNVSLNAIRFSTKRDDGLSPQIINDGGWHFTSIGNVEAIKNKIKSWGHREFNTAATLNSIEYNVRYGYDIFRRPGFGRLEYIPVTSGMLPEYLVSNAGKFERLIGPEIEKENLFQLVYYTAYFYLRSKAAGVFRRLRIIASALQVSRS